MRFHVLGLGSIGSLIAFHLRSALPKSPISLIVKTAHAFPLRRRALRGLPLPPLGPESPERDYATEQQAQVGVERDGRQRVVGGFDIEIWGARGTPQPDREKPSTTAASSNLSPWSRRLRSLSIPPMGEGQSDKIDSLIVTLKTPVTLSALASLKPRISSSTVITLLQNGMGVYDELCTELWPDPSSRPYFILGTTTHGVTSTNEFGRVIHRSRSGEGDVKWGMVPDPRKMIDLEKWIWGSEVGRLPILSPPPSPSLPLPPPPTTVPINLVPLHTTLEALISLHNLSSSLLPMPHLHHQLLLKLALNSIINPLTAILGSGTLPNGLLSTSQPANRLIKLLAEETSAVLTAYIHNLATPHSAPSDIVRLFSVESLRYRTTALVRSTAENISSMAGDVFKGRMTEIDYINGYLINLGSKLGIETPNHRMVRQMVKFKTEINGLNPQSLPEGLKKGSRKPVVAGGVLRPKPVSKKELKRLAWIERGKANKAEEVRLAEESKKSIGESHETAAEEVIETKDITQEREGTEEPSHAGHEDEKEVAKLPASADTQYQHQHPFG